MPDSLPEILKVAGQILDILCQLHGDLKPSNVLVKPNSKLAVIDLEFAERVKEDKIQSKGSFGMLLPSVLFIYTNSLIRQQTQAPAVTWRPSCCCVHR